MPSSAHQKIPQFLRRVIPEGRIVMVSKKGWCRQPGFGRKHQSQKTSLKPQHPGVVLKNAKPHLHFLQVLPGSSSHPRDGEAFFCPADEPVPALKSETVKRGYFLLLEWRTVRRTPKSIRSHLADLTPTDLFRLKQAMTRVHGETWITSKPDAGPR